MISRRGLGLSLLLSLGYGRARAAPGDFKTWLDGVRREALSQGISRPTLNRALAGVTLLPRVIELDRRQPETTLTFAQYIDRVVTPERRVEAREHLAQNRALLDAVGARFGVAPRFIVALWGIETDFGHVVGNFPVIPALATLAYDGRRAAFFRSELLNALRIVDRQHIDPRRMLGSWAGAMGQSQFMPSSFLAYAVSYRGTGAPDIWNRRDDVFASIANYLSRAGWRRGEGWGDAVALPPGLAPSAETGARPLGDWSAMGIRRVDGKPLAAEARKASLILPAGPTGPGFLVYDNFRVLLKWNNSHYFAIAVGDLADSLAHP
ncbi:MAG TPA: lytic murein transglycosylase [Stellaceae bacterium]|nr:lytic murein transglycosylase [Stellaceae bacterium]